MSVLQAESGLPNIMAGSMPLERAAFLDDFLKVGAVHILHHEEMQIAVLIDVVSVDDIRMVKSGDRAGFAIKAIPRESSAALAVGRAA